MKRAKILVIEGTDGSGKETQSAALEENLKAQGLNVIRYSFPNYDSPTGRIIGGPYLGKKEICDTYFPETSANVDPLVSSVLYAADRRYNFMNNGIEDAILGGEYDVVILDRYTTSNMGHQACKGKTIPEKDFILSWIENLEFGEMELPRPDKVIFLHMPLAASKELRKNRASGDGNEDNDEHLRNAELTYLYAAKKYGWHYINCINGSEYRTREDIRTIEEISADIIEVANKLLQEPSPEIRRLTRFMGGN